jgi:hypothetical protein
MDMGNWKLSPKGDSGRRWKSPWQSGKRRASARDKASTNEEGREGGELLTNRGHPEKAWTTEAGSLQRQRGLDARERGGARERARDANPSNEDRRLPAASGPLREPGIHGLEELQSATGRTATPLDTENCQTSGSAQTDSGRTGGTEGRLQWR